MSNMGNIVDSLVANYKIDISKNEWMNTLLKDKRELSANIIKSIQNTLGLEKQNTENSTITKKIPIRQSYKVSVVKKMNKRWIYRVEEGLERLICSVNQNIDNNISWGNQIKINKELCAPKEYVDLIQFNRKTNHITSLIELKAWNEEDSPLYAIIELLKNYFLCDFSNRQYIKNLILLAPEEYYDAWHEITNNKDFKALINELSKQLVVNIEVKKILLKEVTWDKSVNEKLPKLSFVPKKRKTNKYDEITDEKKKLDINECVENKLFSDIYECLLSNSWELV